MARVGVWERSVVSVAVMGLLWTGLWVVPRAPAQASVSAPTVVSVVLP